MPAADAIQAFQPTTCRLESRTISPAPRASKTPSNSSPSGCRIGLYRCRTDGPLDKFIEKNIQRKQRRHVHKHDDVALYIALADSKINIEEHDDVATYRRRRQIKEFRTVAPQDFWQRHLQAAFKHIGYRRETTVQD